MTKMVTIVDAKRRFSELVRTVESGAEVIIVRHGRPVAQLGPAPAKSDEPRRSNGAAILEWLRLHPLPPHLRRSPEEMEADIEAERNAWD